MYIKILYTNCATCSNHQIQRLVRDMFSENKEEVKGYEVKAYVIMLRNRD